MERKRFKKSYPFHITKIKRCHLIHTQNAPLKCPSHANKWIKRKMLTSSHASLLGRIKWSIQLLISPDRLVCGNKFDWLSQSRAWCASSFSLCLGILIINLFLGLPLATPTFIPITEPRLLSIVLPGEYWHRRRGAGVVQPLLPISSMVFIH